MNFMKLIQYSHERRRLKIARMFKLYGSPGTVSLVTRVAFEELGLEYEFVSLSVKNGEHLTPEYRSVHPLARVPALEIAPGEILTETPAILSYLAELAPDAELMPRDRLARARAAEWMSLLSSAVHVAFISFFRPSRFVEDDGAEALRRDGKTRFFQLLQHVEHRLPEAGFVLGERYSLCDAYVTVFFLWARHFGLPVAELPRYSRLAGAVLARAAVRRTLELEGLKAA